MGAQETAAKMPPCSLSLDEGRPLRGTYVCQFLDIFFFGIMYACFVDLVFYVCLYVCFFLSLFLSFLSFFFSLLCFLACTALCSFV